MKINHLSDSRIKIYDGCTEQYRKQYDEDKPVLTERVKGYGVGSVTHNGLEVFYKRDSDERTWVNLKKDIMTGSGMAKETDFKIITESKDILRSWINRNDPHDEVVATYKNKPAIEIKFDVILPGGGVVNGKIDKILWIDDNTVRIVDYKTNQVVFTNQEIRDNTQLGIYTLAAMQMFPNIQNFQVGFDFIRHSYVSRDPYTEDELETLVEYLDYMWDLIKNDNDPYASVDADNCRWCKFKVGCKPYQEMLQSGQLPEQGDTIGTLMKERRHIHTLETMAKNRKKEIDIDLKRALKSSDNNFVEIPGVGSLKLIQTKQTKYPEKKTMEIFGDRAYLVVEVKKTKVDKLLDTLSEADRQELTRSLQISYAGGYIKPKYEDKKNEKMKFETKKNDENQNGDNFLDDF